MNFTRTDFANEFMTDEPTRPPFDIFEHRVKSLRDAPPEPPPILTFEGIRIGTPGGLVTIEGQIKTGKSAILSAMLAAPFLTDPEAEERAFCLRVDLAGGSLLHFDSEQSAPDHHRLLRVAMRRAARDDIPSDLHSVSLLRVPIHERFAALADSVQALRDNETPPRAVLVDGVADLLPGGPNDEAGSIKLVADLLALADEAGLVFVLVLHENPGTDYGKTRGHLGSELWRKSESCLGVTKDPKDGISCLSGKHLRGGHWPKDDAIFFKYDETAAMHVLCANPEAERTAAKTAAKVGELEKLVAAVLPVTGPGAGYAELVRQIENAADVSNGTAKSRLREMLKFSLIRKTEGGYERAI
jgi:hypothetical protein